MEPDYRSPDDVARSEGLTRPKPGAGRGRSLVVLLAALAVAALTARLGIWQLDRAAQKQALQAELDARSTMPPLPQADLAHDPQAATAQHQRAIRLHGTWLAAATVFLDNRQMNGRPGFFVLTPLRLGDPAAGAAPAPSAVWVQRGWVARDNDVRARLPVVPTPPGPVDVVGRVAPPPARLFDLGDDAGGPIRQNLDLEASALALGLNVLPLSVLQTDVPSSGPDGLLREWPAPAADIQKHYGYAFQWFAMCAVVVGLYTWFQIIRPRRRPHRETA